MLNCSLACMKQEWHNQSIFDCFYTFIVRTRCTLDSFASRTIFATQFVPANGITDTESLKISAQKCSFSLPSLQPTKSSNYKRLNVKTLSSLHANRTNHDFTTLNLTSWHQGVTITRCQARYFLLAPIQYIIILVLLYYL